MTTMATTTCMTRATAKPLKHNDKNGYCHHQHKGWVLSTLYTSLHSVHPQKLPRQCILYHHPSHLHHPPHWWASRIFQQRSWQPALNWHLAFEWSTVPVSFHNLICQLSQFTPYVHSHIQHPLCPPYDDDDDDDGLINATTSQATVMALPTTSMTMMTPLAPAPAWQWQQQKQQLHHHTTMTNVTNPTHHQHNNDSQHQH